MSATMPLTLSSRADTPADRRRVTVAVVVSIGAVFVATTLATLLFLHLRRRKKEKVEDARWHSDRDDDNELYDMEQGGRPPRGYPQHQRRQHSPG